MPRIDPYQLLNTLEVLLSPSGGIKSADEVVRIVTLMHKFSKKLVSKCIYVQILLSTTPELLDHFLEENGWDLLNTWFSDAITSQNWPFCNEMLRLFQYCPISSRRLKDNVEHNQAPRLINQLRQEPQVDEEIRKLAAEVYDKWLKILTPKNNGIIENNNSNVVITLKVPPPPQNVKKSIQDDESSNGSSISVLQSVAEEVSESLKKEDEEKKDKKVTKVEKRVVKEKEKDKKSLKEKEREKSSSKSDKDRIKSREKDKEEVKKKRKEERDKEKEKERKRFRPDRRDEVDPQEKQRIKEIARRLKEETQAKKDKDTLNKLGGGTGSTSSLGKIPKIPKKTEEKKKAPSFEEMLGGLDSKPKTVKTPMNKNKTASLLEGLTKPSSSASKTSSSSKSDHKHSHSHSHSHSNMKSSSLSSLSSSKKDYVTKKPEKSSSSSSHKKLNAVSPLPMPDRKRASLDSESPKSSKSPHNVSESTSFMDAIFSAMGGNEPRKKKRRLSDNNEVIKKSNQEHSKVKDENEAPKKNDEEMNGEDKNEDSDEKEDGSAPMFSFYRDTLENPEERKEETARPKRKPRHIIKETGEENAKSDKSSSDEKEESSNDIPFEEPESMPREVKGILVYHRGRDKRNKSITWQPESKLVAVKYFEIDEGERVNVNKIKFENMREMELKMEKAAIKSKGSMEEESPENNWYTPKKFKVIDKRDPPFVPGNLSQEKEIQFAREKNVLQALYFSREMTPSTPTEPDLEHFQRPRVATVTVPLEEVPDDGEEPAGIMDYTKKGWPEAKVNQVDKQADIESHFSLPPALSSLLNTVNLQNLLPATSKLSPEEQQTLAAQTEAMKALGILPGLDAKPGFPPPTTTNGGSPTTTPSSTVPSVSVPVPPPTMNVPPPVMSNPQGPPESFQPPPQQQPPFSAPPFGAPPGMPPPNFNPPMPRMGMRPNAPFPGGPPPRQGPAGFRPPHRGGFVNGRGGFPMRTPHRGGFQRPAGHRAENDHKIKTKPCMYYASGFCREGDNCRFIHDPSEQKVN